MKIVYLLTRSDSFGGSQAHVAELSTNLTARGHDVSVLIGGNGSVLTKMKALGIHCESIPHLVRAIQPSNDVRATIEIRAALLRIAPDLISAHSAKAGFLGRVAGATLGIPAIFTAHGWSIGDRISKQQGRIFLQIEKIASKFTAAIINVCDFEKDFAVSRGVGHESKMRVVHNGVPDIEPYLFASPEIQPPTLVTVARMESPKDHETLLGALANIKHLNWHFHWIGDGPLYERIRTLTETLGLSGRVRFWGAIDNVEQALANAQLFVLSSRSEGFPRSILEAMRAGLPVVASDVGGIREAVIDGETGRVCPRSDVSRLANTLQDLICNPALRRSMGTAGRLRYERFFTIARMLTATLQVYREVLYRT